MMDSVIGRHSLESYNDETNDGVVWTFQTDEHPGSTDNRLHGGLERRDSAERLLVTFNEALPKWNHCCGVTIIVDICPRAMDMLRSSPHPPKVSLYVAADELHEKRDRRLWPENVYELSPDWQSQHHLKLYLLWDNHGPFDGKVRHHLVLENSLTARMRETAIEVASADSINPSRAAGTSFIFHHHAKSDPCLLTRVVHSETMVPIMPASILSTWIIVPVAVRLLAAARQPEFPFEIWRGVFMCLQEEALREGWDYSGQDSPENISCALVLRQWNANEHSTRV